jgi:hypothetical protein
MPIGGLEITVVHLWFPKGSVEINSVLNWHGCGQKIWYAVIGRAVSREGKFSVPMELERIKFFPHMHAPRDEII